jgi:hypothetical protein
VGLDDRLKLHVSHVYDARRETFYERTQINYLMTDEWNSEVEQFQIMPAYRIRDVAGNLVFSTFVTRFSLQIKFRPSGYASCTTDSSISSMSNSVGEVSDAPGMWLLPHSQAICAHNVRVKSSYYQTNMNGVIRNFVLN